MSTTVLLPSTISIDSISITSTRKETNGKKLESKKLKIITLLPLFVGRMMVLN